MNSYHLMQRESALEINRCTDPFCNAILLSEVVLNKHKFGVLYSCEHPTQNNEKMMKLFLFRIISLCFLLYFLVWQTFYRLPSNNYEDDLTAQFDWDTDSDQTGLPNDAFSKETETSQQEKRKRTLIDYCHQRDAKELLPQGAGNSKIPAYFFRNIIVNDDQKLLYCSIPKVACSNWKRLLMVLNGDAADPWKIRTADVHNRTLGLFRYLNEYAPEDIVHRLNTYYKFMFVRDPFERLVSAYRNKFLDSYKLTLFKELYGRWIISRYRLHADKQALRTGEGVSFPEFVDFILTSAPEFMDRHWMSYDSLCHPCLIYYDYVGKFENLHSEVQELLETLQISNKVQFPFNITSGYKIPTRVMAQRYFKSLTRDVKNELYAKYIHDFKMFGYSANEYL